MGLLRCSGLRLVGLAALSEFLGAVRIGLVLVCWAVLLLLGVAALYAIYWLRIVLATL